MAFKKPTIDKVRPGMVFRVYSRRFKVTNYARVIKRPRGFIKIGGREIFYAIFVNPRNFKRKRLPSDTFFAVWGSEYREDRWKRVK